MVFTSYVFLFVFLPALLLCYFALPRRARNLVLFAFSYAFYGWWRPDFCLLLLFSTVIGFICGREMAKCSQNRRRKAWLWLSVASNLGLLCYFKYANFGIESVNLALSGLGLTPIRWVSIVLPVGISFLTFQTMSYTIDVYRRDVEPTANFLDFGTYVALFPQLVAGPIVRYRQISGELRDRTISRENLAFGVVLFMAGFNKKVLLANNLGLAADEAFQPGTAGLFSNWIGVLAYTFQIYFDFSGYSDMAVGLGAMLGFQFPRNFDSPYRSTSISEFWRRWHMTLSSWIRDYLYFSLGGNRTTPARVYRNLAISMLLCGLWHGANFTFIVWGALHGSLLILERRFGRRSLYDFLPRWPKVLLTLGLVALGWVFFRAESVGHALGMLGHLFDFGGPRWAEDAYWVRSPAMWGLLAVSVATVFFGIDSWVLARKRSIWVSSAELVLFCWAVLELFSQGNNPFLYFQF